MGSKPGIKPTVVYYDSRRGGESRAFSNHCNWPVDIKFNHLITNESKSRHPASYIFLRLRFRAESVFDMPLPKVYATDRAVWEPGFIRYLSPLIPTNSNTALYILCFWRKVDLIQVCASEWTFHEGETSCKGDPYFWMFKVYAANQIEKRDDISYQANLGMEGAFHGTLKVRGAGDSYLRLLYEGTNADDYSDSDED